MSKHHPQIVIVRHGERADKYPHLVPLQEVNNPSLTEVGFRQAFGIGTLLRSSSKIPGSPLVPDPRHHHHHHQFPSSSQPGNEVLDNNHNHNDHGSTKWKVVCSPFLRTLQTASAIMNALGDENLDSSCVEIDFDVGEHMKGPIIPDGVIGLTEEHASQIVKDGFKFCQEKFRDHTLNAGVENTKHNNNNNNTKVAPFVKFGHGDSSHVIPSEPLEASGVRFLKALVRIYRDHVASYEGNAARNNESDNGHSGSGIPNLLIVTHGFAPAQLLKLLYGKEAIDATRIFLCSMMCLQSFESLTDKTQNFILKALEENSQHHSNNHLQNNNNNSSNHDNEKSQDGHHNNVQQGEGLPSDLRPSFAVRWTRGVRWRIPKHQPRVSPRAIHCEQNDDHHDDDGKNVSTSSAHHKGNNNNQVHEAQADGVSPVQPADVTKTFDLVGEKGSRQNLNHQQNENPTSIATQLHFVGSVDQDQLFGDSTFSPAAEEPDVNGVIEKTWYETKAVLQDEATFCLGFGLEAESPPPLLPVVFDAKNSTRLSKSLLASTHEKNSSEK